MLAIPTMYKSLIFLQVLCSLWYKNKEKWNTSEGVIRKRDAMQKHIHYFYTHRNTSILLLKQITTRTVAVKNLKGGTNCIQSKWLALCKKPARRRPFKDDFHAVRQGLWDAPPPLVTLSWPTTCWILLLRNKSPSFKRPSCNKLDVVCYRLPFLFMCRTKCP